MGRRKRIVGKRAQFNDALHDILAEFIEEEEETINNVYREVANETEKMVVAKAPRDSGDYADGWKVIAHAKTDAFGTTISYTVGNPEHYQLTHLLEKGHAVKNQYGAPVRGKARVRGRRHIKPAETWGINELIERLRAKL